MEATTGSQIDFENPYWLRSIGGVIPVAKERPKDDNGAEEESDFDRLIRGTKDAIHSVVNNTCRACGLDMGGADSEETWTWCADIGDRVEEFIREEWKRQDDARRAPEEVAADASENVRLMHEYLRRVNESRKALGMPDLELKTAMPPLGVPPT